jgi:hypothetical protein
MRRSQGMEVGRRQWKERGAWKKRSITALHH